MALDAHSRRLRAIDRRRARLRSELEAIETERAVLVHGMHVDQGRSHQSIADEFGVTKGRIQQLVKQGALLVPAQRRAR